MALQIKWQQVIHPNLQVTKVRRLRSVRPQLQGLGKQGLWQEVVGAGEAEAAKQQRLGNDGLPFLY